MRNSAKYWLFLIGLGSETQIHFFGSIGISELFIFVAAPFVFYRNYRMLKYDGFMTFIWLIILTCIGCVVSSIANETPAILALKGLATPYSLFASLVVVHNFLRKDFDGLNWLLIGSFISSIICIFVFQPETFTVSNGEMATGDAATEAVMGYALFWTGKINAILMLPIKCLYLKMPLSYNCISPLVSMIVALLFSSGSGRSAALISLGGVLLLFFGGKSRRRMFLLGKKIAWLFVVGIVALVAAKGIYSYTASNGLLGDDAKEKYITQTRMGSSALRLLMAGRIEFFICLRAAVDRPIIGYGPKAEDKKGYTLEYLYKYGSPESYSLYIAEELANRKKGFANLIPAHSLIAGYWVYYGLWGLILWVYVLWLLYQYLRYSACAIPQWFGYIALAIPGLIWAIFFSPSVGRIGFPTLMVCILFARAVRSGRMALPLKMEMEARKYDK